jgi:membrane fusion protein (multidrug efflux system)
VKFRHIVLLSGLLLAACSDEQQDVNLEISIPVEVQTVKTGEIKAYVSASATVQAMQSTAIRNETAGIYRLQRNPVTGKPFRIGDRVKKNSVIVRLENEEYLNNLRIDSRKLTLDISEREFEKQKSLYEKGGVTLRELKSSESAYIDARYNYENVLLQAKKLELSAPFDGVLVDVSYYTDGITLEPGQPVFSLMSYDKLYAEVYLPAADMGRVKDGQPVIVSAYESADTLTAKVVQVSPALDSESRTFKATIEVANDENRLPPGTFTKVDIVVDTRDAAIIIPREIVLNKRQGKVVYVVDKGAAFEKIIATGIENEMQVEVIDGLKEKDRLVVRGFETLRDKSRVKVVQ